MEHRTQLDLSNKSEGGTMKVGDLVRLHTSTRRNGSVAGKLGLVVDLDKHSNPIINLGGKIRSFHYTQIEKVINEGR